MVQHRVSNSNTSTQHLVEPYDPNINQNDYITILSMEVPTGKLYQVDAQGNIKKTPAANNASGYAYTRYCPDMETFIQINREVSNNPNMAIVLGYIQGTEVEGGSGEPYRLISTKKFEALALEQGKKVDKFNSEMLQVVQDDGSSIKVATRTKRMFHASSVMLWDKDAVDGMPVELKPDATIKEWMMMLTDCFPEIAGVDYVIINSASGRVLHNGVPISSGNVHIYMQVESAVDVERFGRAALIQSFGRGYGYWRPVFATSTGNQIGKRPWTLFDPTTFSRERLCFDGSPILDTNDINVVLGVLKIEPSDPILVKGTRRRIDTFALETPDGDVLKEMDLQFKVGKGGRVSCVNTLDLTPDVLIHVKDEYTGVESDITMGQFINGAVDRYRCQTPFRPDSNSWAAYLSKEDGASGFMFDVGIHTKFTYNDIVQKFEGEGLGARKNDNDRSASITIDMGGNLQATTQLTNHQIGLNNNEKIRTDRNVDIVSGGDNLHSVDTIPLPPNHQIDYRESFAQALNIPLPPSTLPEPVRLKHDLRNEVTNPKYGSLHHTAKEFAETELGNAQRFCGTYMHDIRYVPIFKSWFNWVGYRWEQCKGADEFARANKMLEVMAKEGANRADDDTYRKWVKTSCSNNGIKNMVKIASTMPEMVIGADRIDQNWYQFGVGNGHVDLRLKDCSVSPNSVAGIDGGGGSYPCEAGACLEGFREPDREVFITKSSDVDYVEGMGCPEWEKMIWEIFSGNGELVSFFQRMVGYSMIGMPLEEVTFFLVGKGSNGKSTVTGVMEELFGEYKSTVNKNLLMSTNNRGNGEAATPALASLKGVRMAVVTETKEGDVLDESVIKSLSGADTITARHLHGSQFEYKSMFVTWLATNHAPIIKSDDFGTWRRVIEIPFNRNFAKELGDKLDKYIGDRIRQNEMSGILNWAIEGVRKYQVEGLNPPAEVLTASANYKERMDLLHNWIEDCCVLSDEFSCSTQALWKSYESYTQQTGDQIIKKGYTLAKKLHARGLTPCRDAGGERGLRGFKGIKLKFVS